MTAATETPALHPASAQIGPLRAEINPGREEEEEEVEEVAGKISAISFSAFFFSLFFWRNLIPSGAKKAGGDMIYAAFSLRRFLLCFLLQAGPGQARPAPF